MLPILAAVQSTPLQTGVVLLGAQVGCDTTGEAGSEHVFSRSHHVCIMVLHMVMQERADAVKLFPTEAEAAAHGAKTFEVDAEFEAQQAALAAQQPQQPAASQPEAAAVAAEPVKKGPTAEDMLTIKAAIANATVS